jgi:hypothetical protein
MSSGNAIFFLVVVLLPLIPAYLLFRLLPSQAEVEGPWQGLKVKLTGAFASYFLLVITLLFMAGAPPTYDVWTIQGRLQFRDQPAGTFDEGTVRFTVKPPGLTVQPNGRFRFTVFRVPDPSGEPQPGSPPRAAARDRTRRAGAHRAVPYPDRRRQVAQVAPRSRWQVRLLSDLTRQDPSHEEPAQRRSQ